MTTASKFAIASVVSLLLAGALSSAPVIHVGTIVPNLILCVLIASSLFTTNAAFFAVLVVVGATLIRQQPVLLDPLSLAVSAAAIGAFLIKQRVVWPDRLGVIILALFGTLVVYLITAPRFILTHTGSFLLEAAANIILSIILFELFGFITGRRHE